MGLPIRLRLTLISGVLMAVVLAAVGIFVYTRLEADLIRTVDAGLRSRADVLLERIAEGGGVAGSGLLDRDEAFAQLLAADGSLVDSPPGLVGPLVDSDDLRSAGTARFVERKVSAGGERVSARLLLTRTSDGQVLVVGASLEDQKDALSGLAGLLAIALPAAVLLACGVGWIVAGAALRPVERLRREADALSVIEPGRQLAVPGTRDELSRLAASLNGMLARLGATVEQERRFVADASHELRTPLANLRGEIDVALRRDRTADELTTTLRSAREETERLARLADDLLVVARMSDAGIPLRLEPTDLGRLVDATIESFRWRADEAGISLVGAHDASATARVDPIRVRQAIGNLVDNALRLTPRGGRVSVSAQRTGVGAEIAIEDTGPGFPSDFLARVGQGFGRPDEARAREGGGTGLGMTIVRAIVQAHGGSLVAANRPEGGARVSMSLPMR